MKKKRIGIFIAKIRTAFEDEIYCLAEAEHPLSSYHEVRTLLHNADIISKSLSFTTFSSISKVFGQ